MENMKKEEVLEIRPGVFEIKVKKEDEVEIAKSIAVKVLGADYHDREKRKRPKSIILKVSAPSKYPIIRPEQRDKDFYTWQALSEHSEKISSKTVRRFFYQERERDVVEIGRYRLIILAFFGKSEAERLYNQGYLCKLRIVYPRRAI
ncbi:MAG: hypothetical protein ACE5GI_06375 [Candidatus Aminicenantales bacterium]